MTPGGHTGTADKDYNLISVLYHALSGADSCHKYIQDAKQAKDDELTAFFEESLKAYRSISEKAKQLVKARV